MDMPAMPRRAAGDVHNAREHGLAGDGQANDQPALAELVDRLGGAAARDGHAQVIYCPPGVYLIADATTVWRSGVQLVGAGAGVTRFVLANPHNRGEPVALARFTEQQHGAGTGHALIEVMFAGFEIDGAGVQLETYDPHAKGLDLQYLKRAVFRDLYIHDTPATGLGCDHLQDSVIESILAERCGRLNDGRQPGGAGIGIGVGGWGDLERCSLNDCIAVGNATNGIFVELQPGKDPPPRGIKITGGHCVGNRRGISDWGCDGLVVCACMMCDNLEAGFDVSARGTSKRGGHGGLLTDCVLDRNGTDGVAIGDTEGRYVIRGNRISHNARFGYRQHDLAPRAAARGMVVEGNDIHGNGADGVRLDAPLTDACVTGNRIRDNGRELPAAGIGVTAPLTRARIRGNRIWEGAHEGQQRPALRIADDARCEDCRFEDNDP
jgi:Pectate lyase superfamily protein/Right handed beta helix region